MVQDGNSSSRQEVTASAGGDVPGDNTSASSVKILEKAEVHEMKEMSTRR